MISTISRSTLSVVTYLCERASGGVDRFEQACICNTDSVRAETNHVTVRLVQLPLRLDVRLSVMVVEAPDVRELRQERARDLLQRRSPVCNNILDCQRNGSQSKDGEH